MSATTAAQFLAATLQQRCLEIATAAAELPAGGERETLLRDRLAAVRRDCFRLFQPTAIAVRIYATASEGVRDMIGAIDAAGGVSAAGHG